VQTYGSIAFAYFFELGSNTCSIQTREAAQAPGRGLWCLCTASASRRLRRELDDSRHGKKRRELGLEVVDRARPVPSGDEFVGTGERIRRTRCLHTSE
jgi:hypothetical protein